MRAKFTEGNIFKHISVMTFSGTAGLIALFLVDLVDTLFLSMLGEVEILAAIGYAGSILFFTLSMGIGLSIGCGALVARLAGSGDKQHTKQFVSHAFLIIFLVGAVTTAALLLFCTSILTALGASGLSLQYGVTYLNIVLPTVPIMGLALACGGIMRAFGEARNAMLMPLLGAVVNAVLDPIFIFVLDWRLEGAAWATVASRITMVGFSLWVIIKHHNLLGAIKTHQLFNDAKTFFSIALPAVLTNLSTPIGVVFITATMATFGDEAVGGNAIVARIQQVAFAGLFALSGAIGPIAAQNWGRARMDRVMETLTESLRFVVIYCLIACLILALACPWIITLFKAEGLTADLLKWFCFGFSATFLFNGATFVTNAMFNNLGLAGFATAFNFGKATVGTIPFAYFGAQVAGPFGIFAGVAIGSAIFACLGVWVALKKVRLLPAEHPPTTPIAAT